MLRGMAKIIGQFVTDHLGSGQQVLDFGCGDQPYKSLVLARGADYCGADFSESADVGIAPDGRLPLPDASFDIVLSIQVLEHVRDLGTYFAEIRRVLKPGGTLILSTHGTWLYHPHPEDHWRWTRTGLQLTIEQHGFRLHEMHSVVGPLATTTMIRLTGFSFFLKRLPVVGGLLSGLLAIVMNLRGLLEDLLTPQQVKFDNGSVYVTLCEAQSR